MHKLQSLGTGHCNCEELSSFNGICRVGKSVSTNKRKAGADLGGDGGDAA